MEEVGEMFRNVVWTYPTKINAADMWYNTQAIKRELRRQNAKQMAGVDRQLNEKT